MKYLLFLLLLISSSAFGQSTYFIRADTTTLEKVGANNELKLKNSTRSRTGAYLKNVGNGVTGFFYSIDSAWVTNDSTLVLRRGDGTITLTIPGGSTGANIYNSNGTIPAATTRTVTLDSGVALVFKGKLPTPFVFPYPVLDTVRVEDGIFKVHGITAGIEVSEETGTFQYGNYQTFIDPSGLRFRHYGDYRLACGGTCGPNTMEFQWFQNAAWPGGVDTILSKMGAHNGYADHHFYLADLTDLYSNANRLLTIEHNGSPFWEAYNNPIGNFPQIIEGNLATAAGIPNYYNWHHIIGGKAAITDTLRLSGQLKYTPNSGAGKIMVSDADGNAAWTSGYSSGTGTTSFVPRWSSSTTLGNGLITDDLTNVAVDDDRNGQTGTGSFRFFVRNSYAGDATGTQFPLVTFWSKASAITQLNLLQLTAPSANTGAALQFTMGRNMANSNMYYNTFHYVGNGSTGNYLERAFYGVGDVMREYASGSVGVGITADNGFKFEVAGTVRHTGTTTIGTGSPSASAKLDVQSTTQGVVFPRMNTTQQNAISSPATGLIIFNTDTAKYRFYNGSAWETFGSGSGGGGGGTPGGSDTEVQFNDGGSFGGDAGMTYNKTDNELLINSGGDVGDYKLQSTSTTNASYFTFGDGNYGTVWKNASMGSKFIWITGSNGSGSYSVETYDAIMQLIGANGMNIKSTANNINLYPGNTFNAAFKSTGLALYNASAPGSSETDGIILYSQDVSSSAELRVRDEAGNITTLSPHNFNGIPMGKSEEQAWSYYSEKDGKYITVDMLKAMRTIEELTRRVEKLEKELNMKSKPPVKLVYKGKVKNLPK